MIIMVTECNKFSYSTKQLSTIQMYRSTLVVLNMWCRCTAAAQPFEIVSAAWARPFVVIYSPSTKLSQLKLFYSVPNVLIFFFTRFIRPSIPYLYHTTEKGLILLLFPTFFRVVTFIRLNTFTTDSFILC